MAEHSPTDAVAAGTLSDGTDEHLERLVAVVGTRQTDQSLEMLTGVRAVCPEALDLIETYARYAVRHRTSIAKVYGDLRRDQTEEEDRLSEQDVARRLLEMVSGWLDEARPAESIRNWLPVVASVNRWDQMTALMQPADRSDHPRRQWTLRVGRDCAPLAYMLGMSLDEARHEQSAGRLTVDGLRLMVALRGIPVQAP